MKDFIIQLFGILIVILGGAFFLKGKIKNPFGKKKGSFQEPPVINPLPEPPDLEKIIEEFKDETHEESANSVTDMLGKLFPRN